MGHGSSAGAPKKARSVGSQHVMNAYYIVGNIPHVYIR